MLSILIRYFYEPYSLTDNPVFVYSMVAIIRQGRWLLQEDNSPEDRSNRGPLKFHTKVPLMSVAAFRGNTFLLFVWS